MKAEVEMTKWWSALSISSKEQISGKVYPECSVWWNEPTTDEQLAVKAASNIERGPRNKSKGFT